MAERIQKLYNPHLSNLSEAKGKQSLYSLRLNSLGIRLTPFCLCTETDSESWFILQHSKYMHGQEGNGDSGTESKEGERGWDRIRVLFPVSGPLPCSRMRYPIITFPGILYDDVALLSFSRMSHPRR